MPGTHLFLSALWFVSSFVSIYPYILGFKNRSELKQPYSAAWMFSIICAVACALTISAVHAISPTGPENILDWSNVYHVAAYVANLAFATMIFKKDSQTRIATIETWSVLKKIPSLISALWWGAIEIIIFCCVSIFEFQRGLLQK